MLRILRGALAGAGGGAAGTTALNAVTYLDMAVRGRPASSTPQQTVERLSSSAHLRVPGRGEKRQNRLAGLGPLTGLATGVAVGAVAGVAGALGLRLPAVVTAVAIGGGAMVAANGPMTLLGLTNPASWTVADWVSDVVPHVAYGAVTAGVLRRLVA